MSEYERRSPVSALLRGARCLPGAPAPPQSLYNKLYSKIALYIALQRRQFVTRRM